MRELNTASVRIKILTNVTHPTRLFFCDTKIHDEYVLKTNTPTPLFTITAEFLGKYTIDTRKIETTPTQNRAPWSVSTNETLDLTFPSDQLYDTSDIT
jgi:hypothetical protein